MSLQEWCRAASNSHSDADPWPVQVRSTPDAGSGMFATSDIKAGTVLVHISNSIFINTSTIVQQGQSGRPHTHALHRAIEAMEAYHRAKSNGRSRTNMDANNGCIGQTPTERLYLMLFLIWGRRYTFAGNNNYEPTDWDLYFRSLPQTFSTPVYYSPGTVEHQLLCGTGLDEAVQAKKARLAQESRQYAEILQCINPAEATEMIDVAAMAASNQADWTWADAVVWSRSMSFASTLSTPGVEPSLDPVRHADDLHIIPFIDMCNHADPATSRWEYSPTQLETRLISIVSMRKGDQVTISYGAKPTSEFLFLHGFVLQSNQNTQIQFPAPFIELSMLDTDMHGMEEVEEEKPMADASIASSSVQDHGMGKDVLTDMTYDTVASTARIEIDTARLDGCGLDAPSLRQSDMTRAAMASIADKQHILRVLGISPMITLSPRAASVDLDTTALPNATFGMIDSASLIALYLSVMTSEDGLCRITTARSSMTDSTENGNGHDSQVQMEIAGVQITAALGREGIASAIARLPRCEILALRVYTVVVLEIESRLTKLVESELDLSAEVDADHRRDDTSYASIDIVRRGMLEMLYDAYAVLTELQEVYANRPVVKEYLHQMQM
ncbi:hypothetical protein BASA50_003983 [Batrachochytrium salamandrivorans]|uniref:SET domain-containing protein n=1 Tax=Batrachochytrium salamandrivorans TaxID=1357716 RepID=A0ABQ8FJY8_9FUNG|nr:hypothetical protein BASA50_003983 [Batrachochytrium salamandrivorans]KAH9249011.1 hypothetical protein BASA81_013307 [Batrachochytrium salamandrivorans]KAH9272465.1 hypothetical protein BASA83_005272 [Batrachochytrium salamandrivorans]